LISDLDLYDCILYRWGSVYVFPHP